MVEFNVKTILTKAEFADRVGRTRSCVSNWIAGGKISAAALIGDGRSARIWLERAEADLSASLDPSQQVAQAEPFVRSSLAPETPPAREIRESSATSARSLSAEREANLARRAKADADKSEHDAEAARRKLALDEGRYVIAAAAQAAWAREMAKAIADFEMFIAQELPRKVGEQFNIDWRTVSNLTREQFREFRERCAIDARERREALKNETDQPSDSAT